MATKLWGSMLTGIAQGFQDYQQGQEDLAYTRQARMNQLASQQLANQAQTLQNAQQQQTLQNADLTHKYWVSALQDNGTQEGQATTQQATPAGGAQVASAAQGPTPAAGNFKVSGPLSVTQLGDLDQKYGLPAGTAYGLMNAESAGNPDAVSPKGAVGQFQVMPSTAAQPGYGLKPFNPKDPDGAMGYFAKLYQKAGGDMSRALQMWNAGPGGNPDNPETKAFVPRVLKGQQQFAQANALDQSKQQPTPAEAVTAREGAGIDTPVPVYQQAAQAQARQIQVMTRAAQNAERDGHPELAQNFYAQAQKLQDQQIALQQKANAVQKDANEQTSKLAASVKDQSSYNGFQSQLQQNPAMRATVAGLNLTGDYALDRNKLQSVAERSESLKDQQDIALRRQEFELKQRKEQRDQAKIDQAQVQAQQVQQRDAARQADLQQKGVPYAPSVEASLPPGSSPQVIQKAAQSVQKAQIAYQKDNMTALNASRQTQTLAGTLLGLLRTEGDPNAVSTGGFAQRFIPKYGEFRTAHDNQRQEFDKVSNQLVTAATQSLGAAGGGRSSFTAAMYDRVKTQKPSLDLSPETNRKIAGEYYNIAAMAQNKATFMNEFMRNNPGSIPQSGELAWASYEQSLGPSIIVDPSAEGGYRLNTAGVPTTPDGKPNTQYRDWHDYFRQGNQ